MTSTPYNNNINIYEVFHIKKPMEPSNKEVKKIPTFILKLWNIVNDPELTHIIEWGEAGISFYIKQPYVMYKKVLPLYFKHSNLNSFIRQLNMYGFKKNTDIERQGFANLNSMDIFQFSHQYFIRGRYDLLDNIKRKTPNSSRSHETCTGIENHFKNSETIKLLDEIKNLKAKQIVTENISEQLALQYEAFKKEIDTFNARYRMQQNVIRKLCGVISAFANQKSTSKIVNSPHLFAINRDKRRTLKDNIHVNYSPSQDETDYVDLEYLNRTINNTDKNH